MNARAYVYLSITALFWGGNSVAGKMAVGHVSPMMLTTLRWLIALAVILVLMTPQIRRDWQKIRQHWLQLLAYGAIGFTMFNAFLYSAVQYTSAINAVILQAGIPMLIFIFNFALFKMKASFAQVIGFTVTLIGVLITAAHGDLASLVRLSFNFGDALMILACIVYAAYTVALRWKPAMHWQSFIAAPAFGALLSAIPLLVWEIGKDAAIMPDATGWAIVLYAAIFPSLMSQVLYVRGVEMIGANRAGLFINAIPVFGTLLSVLLVEEIFRPFHLVALALVLGGIAVAERGRPKPPQ
ncbi:EamA family transporter [Sinorhizobium medicae]|uniref:EamA family transporter n=1 Tax=Sinorhizobium medicae TaxID=110321 RepID=A0A6G1WFW8_9HYPH|nr:DMT family transporter [Sinorhizobium medicae]MBO1943071.1 DMT family transporter [Sinorhizobium medicae]MBO1959623.1 DMT family transporter [Sinorhizobium medicae]MDX0405172.1 EamA family transporter [Sinorhizobium medicae]MDX0410843.1 EamA family transporter [Sinorhizobium medicae]MDX0417270.1 EamA family transporter [Sinorhizobium medicae]